MDIDKFIKQQLTLAATTKEGYRRNLLAFAGSTLCNEPTEEDVYNYVAELKKRGCGDNHISRILYAIKRYAKWAKLDIFSEGKIEIPGFEFKEPSEVVSEEEVENLITAGISPLEKAIVAVLYDTGCRIVELLRLKVDDVDWDTGEIKLTRKGRRQRREGIAIFPETLEFLKEYRRWRGITRGLLFPYQYNELRSWMIALAKRAKVKFPRYSLFHNLRHARAVHLRLRGVPLEVISDQLGHQSIATTQRIYARLTPAQLRDKVPPPPWAQDVNKSN